MRPLLGCLKGIEETLHPRLFSGRRIFLDNPLLSGSIKLLYHIPQGQFGFSDLLFMGQRYEFFSAGPDGTPHRPIPEPALFTLPMTLFSGTTFTCQKKTPTIELSGPAHRTRYLQSPETGIPDRRLI
jgi:hypothetical protein